MPEFFVILIKVNIALVLFCLGYYLVLRKLTFYTINRAYLITGILFSSVYPFIDLSVFAQRHQEIVAPVQNVVIIWQAPAQNIIKHAAYWNWLEILFWAGAAVLAARLLFQLASLYSIYRRSTAGNINGQNIRVVSADISPFSFWKSIYVNPEKLSAADLKNVLAHEQVHVDEWHTLDILLTEVSVIFYWFNPGIWMMKRAVRENIEFITDRKILQKGLDSKAYQYSLLSITFDQPAPAITSNFNFSTLKKRIMMMNAKRSSKITLTRYALLVPVVVVCLLSFSLSKAAVVKTNPALKAVADAVKTINNVVLNNDTVPAAKTVTGTVTVKKGVNGTTKVITLKGADVNGLTVVIDRPAAHPRGVSVAGRRPGQKDSVLSFTVADKPLATYQTSNLTGIFKGDSILFTRNSMLNGVTTYNFRTTSDGMVHVSTPDKAMAKTVTGFTIKGDTLSQGNIKYYNNLGFAGRGDVTNLSPVYKVLPGTPIKDANGMWSLNTTEPNGKQQPLYIVDGKVVNQKDMRSFEGSLVYLTPEAAILKYGTKGEYGALIITTKKK